MKKIILSFCFTALALVMFAQQPYFRAAWISTVANIDFPSKAAIGNYKQQQKEMIDMLDAFKAMNLNAVVFQVRPTADA